MIKKYGDAQSINVIRNPSKIVKKASEDMEQQILNFQSEEEEKKQNKTER